MAKVAEKTGAKLKYIYLTDDYQLNMQDFYDNLTDDVKIVSITKQHQNTAGTCPDIKYIIESAKKKGAVVCIDAAQAALHSKIDVIDLGCDFLVFSGHKMRRSWNWRLIWKGRNF